MNGAIISVDNLETSWTGGTIKVDRHSASGAPKLHRKHLISWCISPAEACQETPTTVEAEHIVSQTDSQYLLLKIR